MRFWFILYRKFRQNFSIKRISSIRTSSLAYIYLCKGRYIGMAWWILFIFSAGMPKASYIIIRQISTLFLVNDRTKMKRHILGLVIDWYIANCKK